MKKSRRSRTIIFITLLLISFISSPVRAWHDKTHLMIAKAGGYANWYNASGADIIKIKADEIEKYNHWFNNNDNIAVTEALIADQEKRYNASRDEEGHLYGAILSALRDYRTAERGGKYADYHLALAAHYIGDLSNPLHNTRNDCFNSAGDRHSVNDGIVEKEVWENTSNIAKNVYEINLSSKSFEDDLKKQISRIANTSRELGMKMRKENRNMTPVEAYVQLGHSASLLKAVLKTVSTNK